MTLTIGKDGMAQIGPRISAALAEGAATSGLGQTLGAGAIPGGDDWPPARDAVTRSMSYDAPDFSGDAERNRDRDVMNKSLVEDMAKSVVNGRASIDIDVAGAKASQDWGEKNLFRETRSKAAPQMPNSLGGAKGDDRSGSSEGAQQEE